MSEEKIEYQLVVKYWSGVMMSIPKEGSRWVCVNSFTSDCASGRFISDQIYIFEGVGHDDDFVLVAEKYLKEENSKRTRMLHYGHDIYPRELEECFVEATVENMEKLEQRKKKLEQRKKKLEQDKTRIAAGKCIVCGAPVGWLRKNLFGKKTCSLH